MLSGQITNANDTTLTVEIDRASFFSRLKDKLYSLWLYIKNNPVLTCSIIALLVGIGVFTGGIGLVGPIALVGLIKFGAFVLGAIIGAGLTFSPCVYKTLSGGTLLAAMTPGAILTVIMWLNPLNPVAALAGIIFCGVGLIAAFTGFCAMIASCLTTPIRNYDSDQDHSAPAAQSTSTGPSNSYNRSLPAKLRPTPGAQATNNSVTSAIVPVEPKPLAASIPTRAVPSPSPAA